MKVEQLLTSKSTEDWKSALARLPQVISKYSAKRKTTSAVNIVELDTWYRKEIGLTISKRQPPYLKKVELLKIVKRHLLFGSMRADFLNRIDNNTKQEVEEISTHAFHVVVSGDSRNIGCVLEAINILNKLNGVGFAIATAILATFNENIPFMSDQIVRIASKSSKSKYSAKYFEKVFSFCTDLSNGLDDISVRDVQDAIWITAKIFNGSKSSKLIVPPLELVELPTSEDSTIEDEY